MMSYEISFSGMNQYPCVCSDILTVVCLEVVINSLTGFSEQERENSKGNV